MLDEFSKPAPPAASTTDPAPKTMEETHGLGDMDALSEEDFAKHLQDGMAELLGGMDGNPQLASEFESMMKNLTSGAGMEGLEGLIPQPGAAPALQAPKPSVPSASAPEKTKAPASEESFQDTIKKLQEKIAASGDQATAAAQEEPTDDILAELMKQMGAGSLDGEGGEEDFSKMLLGMMEQLTNKEILYTPMKELDDKYPEWMEKNAKTTPEEDLKRYRDIQRIVKEIVGKFEESTYKDSNVADREYIVERMQLVSHTICLLVTRDGMLTSIRCNRQALHQLTSSVIWHQHKRLSAHRTRAVLSSNYWIPLFTLYTRSFVPP